MTLYKYCATCKKLKPVSDFSKNNASTDGYQHSCKECEKLRQRNIYNNKFLPVDRSIVVKMKMQGYNISEIAKKNNYKLQEVRKTIKQIEKYLKGDI